MKINDEYIVTVEKLVNEGKGLAKIDNFPVFTDNVCAGDKIKIKIDKIKKTYAFAKLTEIIEPSKYRIEPACPFSGKCGSCSWLFIDYNEQLRQKKNIVYETIKNIAGLDFYIEDTIPSPKIFEYRCKVQLPVSQTKVSKRILSGYYKNNSHDLINIKCCKLHPDLINEINEYIKLTAQEHNINAYDEKTQKGLLRHIIYRFSHDLSQILIIFVINANTIDNKLVTLAKLIKDKYPQIKGICANINTKPTNVIMGTDTKVISGCDYIIEELGGIKYKISANSFFQVNPLCAELIFNKVKDLIDIQNPRILDAYSGVSSFGIWLSSCASSVTCIEEVISASKDAYDNLKLNNINNVEIINGDAGENFKKLIKNKEYFNVSIIDPPRKGCSEEALEYLTKLTSEYIIYVSCNVSTLARDIKILSSKGFKPQYIQPVDMFPNTYHAETICLLKKT